MQNLAKIDYWGMVSKIVNNSTTGIATGNPTFDLES